MSQKVEIEVQSKAKSMTKKELLKQNPKKLFQKEDFGLRKEIIAAKKEALVNALKIPPTINQFRRFLGEKDLAECTEIFSKYRPETKKEKKERLSKERTGPKPVLVKQGIRHITKLIEEKKASLVLIACDVEPIQVVLFLPALCKKMGVSYALVEKMSDLGNMIGRKPTTCICLERVGSEMKSKFDTFKNKCDELFSSKYELTMQKWGNTKKE